VNRLSGEAAPEGIKDMDMKKILWPNDFSEMALTALPYVASLVEKYDSELHVLHVAPDLSDYGHFWGRPDPNHVEGMHAFALKGAERKLTEFCRNELAACPTYRIHVKLGDPAEEILKAVDELGIDLLVMPLRAGRNGGSLGSVTRKVMRETSVPVLAISPGRPGPGRRE
jgi:nucleotide-binding universal stress UspA family protein